MDPFIIVAGDIYVIEQCDNNFANLTVYGFET